VQGGQMLCSWAARKIGDIHKVLQLLYQTTQTNHSSLRWVDWTWMTDDNAWNKIHWIEDTAMYTPVWPVSFRASRGWSHEQIKNMGHQVCTLMLWVFLLDYIPIRDMVLPEWENQMVWNCICEFALNKEKARLEHMIIHTFPQDPWSVMAPSIQLCKNVITLRLVLNLDKLHRIKLLSWHRYTRSLVTTLYIAPNRCQKVISVQVMHPEASWDIIQGQLRIHCFLGSEKLYVTQLGQSCRENCSFGLLHGRSLGVSFSPKFSKELAIKSCKKNLSRSLFGVLRTSCCWPCQ
jgi:hypothetical protein